MKKLLLLLAISICSCNYNRVHINREKDNEEGKFFLKVFYKKIADKRFGEIDKMASDSLKQLAGPDGMKKMTTFINIKVGGYQSYSVSDYYTREVEGSKNETSYNYKLNVKYKKGSIVEIIGLIKRNGSEIELNSYHANSDLLIH